MASITPASRGTSMFQLSLAFNISVLPPPLYNSMAIFAENKTTEICDERGVMKLQTKMSNKENLEPENGHATYKERMFHIEGTYYDFDYGTDEDTDDASETALVNDEEEYIEIKDQVYRDKLAELKNQLNQLENFEHPAYVERAKELEEEYVERQFKNDIFFAVEVERVQRDHELERKAAYIEFNEKQKELQESLIADLEEKKKIYEVDRDSLEIVNDAVEVIPLPIRKLRRRGNDPVLTPEPKRRKTSPNTQHIKFQLTEEEVDEDLRRINEMPVYRSTDDQDSNEGISIEYGNSSDIRVENGKLYYEKYWYHRGQQIYYEGKEVGCKNSAVISTINSAEVWVKRTIDNEKYQILVSELVKGAITLKRRSA